MISVKFRWSITQSSIVRIRPPTFVNKIVSADDKFMYVEGWDATPVENHLFRVPLMASRKLSLQNNQGGTRQHSRRFSFTWINSPAQSPMMTSVCDTASNDGKEPKIIYQENINDLHPYKPFIASHASSEIGFVQSDDSTKIYYKLTKTPKTTTKIPIVVYVYGGPGVQKLKMSGHRWSFNFCSKWL